MDMGMGRNMRTMGAPIPLVVPPWGHNQKPRVPNSEGGTGKQSYEEIFLT